MKKFNKVFMTLGVAAMTLGLGSCVGDLDMSPMDPNEKTDISDNIDAVFADIYLNFGTAGPNGESPIAGGFDGGMATFSRAIFNYEELPTDEACWLWDPEKFGQINNGLVQPGLPVMLGGYTRLMINITLCNQFIQNVNNGSFSLDENGQKRAQEYVRQARALRGLCYYYMLSFYDKIPYSDESVEMSSIPPQLSRAEVYNLVTEDLEKVVAEWKAIDPNQKPNYGFVGLDAAEAFLMKIYLNAEVFAGAPAYDKCYAHAKAIIDRLGKGGAYGNGLAQSYQGVFGASNKKYVLGNPGSAVNEIIMSIPANDPEFMGYAGATHLILGFVGTSGVQPTVAMPTRDSSLSEEQLCAGNLIYTATQEEYDAQLATYNSAEDWAKTVSYSINNVNYSFDPSVNQWCSRAWLNVSDEWKCMVARKAFVSKFEWNDANMSESDDTRVKLWFTSKNGFSPENVETLIGDNWGKNGYIPMKYSNWNYNEAGEISGPQPTPRGQAVADYAVVRLAEVYLSAAEAIVAGSLGKADEALTYVNYVRQRAYQDTEHNFAQVNMQIIRDERCRELYQENNRRTDLIRWNQWCTGYNWEWKGGVQKGTNLPEYTKLYPIPSSTIIAAGGALEQTTGY